ncbi:MAG: hypothetical protein ACO3DK_02360 [Bacteroidia bacterium]
MRKITFILFALGAFTLSSCGSGTDQAAFSEEETSQQDSIDESAMDFEALEAMDDSGDAPEQEPRAEQREPMTPAEPGSALPQP